MKWVMLTPGTGNFYCGSCLRDHSVAKGLIKLGVDVTLTPLYLPHVAEEGHNTSPLFFGGLNVYLQQKFKMFKYTPTWMDRIFDHPLILKFLSRFSGLTSPQDLGEMTLSSLNIENSGQIKELNKLVAWLKKDIQPDAIILSNCLLVGFAPQLKQELNCKIFCTLQGEDSFLDSLPSPYKEKCWESLQEKSKFIELFLPVSDTYAQIMMNRIPLSPQKIETVYNGINLEGLNKEIITPNPPSIVFLANVIPGKGLETLIDAFILLKKNHDLPLLRLIIMGSTTPFTRDFLENMLKKLEDAELLEFTDIHTNVDRENKYKILKKGTVLSVPATYGESFGLYILEALALGIPVVQPDHGAFREILHQVKGGLLTRPDDAEDLSLKLKQIIIDPDYRMELGEQGQEIVWDKFSLEAMANHFKSSIESRL